MSLGSQIIRLQQDYQPLFEAQLEDETEKLRSAFEGVSATAKSMLAAWRLRDMDAVEHFRAMGEQVRLMCSYALINTRCAFELLGLLTSPSPEDKLRLILTVAAGEVLLKTVQERFLTMYKAMPEGLHNASELAYYVSATRMLGPEYADLMLITRLVSDLDLNDAVQHRIAMARALKVAMRPLVYTLFEEEVRDASFLKSLHIKG
jgi:hypothetical protein